MQKLAQVFVGTWDWFRLVEGRDELILDTDWEGEWGPICEAAGVVLEDPESWITTVAFVEKRHSAIRVGDLAVCQGHGSDVKFLRLIEEGISNG